MMAIQVGRTGLAMLVLLVAAVLPGCIVHLERETRVVTIDHVAGKALRVTTDNGAVSVDKGEDKSDPGKVVVVAELKARSLERLANSTISATRDTDGTLVLAVQWADGRRLGSEGCGFDVTIPDAVGVDLRTGNGAIRMRGLAGEATLETSNGRITVLGHDGPVEAETSNGSVELEDIAGDVAVETSNGRIDVEGCAGKAECDTSNGSIMIRLDAKSPGPVKAETSNGDITLAVGPAFRGRLVMGTSNGSVRVSERSGARLLSMRRNFAELAYGDEAAETIESSARTSNGSVEVRVEKP
jgi:DUF4097 and DUF4098 domain-containing protein YvlB